MRFRMFRRTVRCFSAREHYIEYTLIWFAAPEQEQELLPVAEPLADKRKLRLLEVDFRS
jgi:hypothetical protein